jgi:hypothetical protein
MKRRGFGRNSSASFVICVHGSSRPKQYKPALRAGDELQVAIVAR